MKSHIKNHLTNVTLDSFREWMDEAFACYASATGPKRKRVELGISGGGLICVRVNREQKYHFRTPQEGIEKYKEELTS